MTERRPAYRVRKDNQGTSAESTLSGPQIDRLGAELLKRCGWFTVGFSSNARMPSGSKGWPDRWAAKDDVTILIEIKGRGDYLSPAQIEFAERIRPHLGPHLRYVLARSVEDIADAIGG